MSYTLRAGTVADIQALAGAMPRRMQLAMLQQARESELFTVEVDDGSGRLLIAGGFWPWPDGHNYEEAWMLTNRGVTLPPKILLDACLRLLDARDTGRDVVAFIDTAKPKHMRFAAFLGFESPHLPVLPILRRDCQLMVWRA